VLDPPAALVPFPPLLQAASARASMAQQAAAIPET
jgi:hypothetical protein